MWKETRIHAAPEGVLVETAIIDEHGTRNAQKLVRNGKLWFVDEALSSYVYYTPTHWREAT